MELKKCEICQKEYEENRPIDVNICDYCKESSSFI